MVSARGYYRFGNRATIADLADHDRIALEHLSEAFQYRLRENS